MHKLLSPDSSKIGRPVDATSQPDAVPTKYINGSPLSLIRDMETIVGEENVHGRLTDLVRFSSDAGPYRAIPNIVVSARSADDLSKLMKYCRENSRHMTFRAAGTSLNGQAMSDDILVDVKTNFMGMEVRDNGAKLWSRPGVILGDAQAVLGRHGFMLGPDPGSTSVCTIGGVLADNSGGMRCSLERDAYHCVDELTFVLPSGTIVDTTKGDAALKAQEPELHAQLLEFRDRLRANTDMVEFLRRKFSIRNTNGLRLDAFLDEDEPFTGGTSKEEGIAYHAFLQYVTYGKDVRGELARMVREGLLTSGQAALLDADHLERILALPCLSALAGKRCLREQSFLVRLQADEMLETDAADDVVFQGAVDLLVQDDDGYTVIDYKYSVLSDEALKEKYAVQIRLYRKAVARVLRIDENTVRARIVNIARCREIAM